MSRIHFEPRLVQVRLGMDLFRAPKTCFFSIHKSSNLRPCHSNQQALVTLGKILMELTDNHQWDIKFLWKNTLVTYSSYIGETLANVKIIIQISFVHFLQGIGQVSSNPTRTRVKDVSNSIILVYICFPIPSPTWALLMKVDLSKNCWAGWIHPAYTLMHQIKSWKRIIVIT